VKVLARSPVLAAPGLVLPEQAPGRRQLCSAGLMIVFAELALALRWQLEWLTLWVVAWASMISLHFLASRC